MAEERLHGRRADVEDAGPDRLRQYRQHRRRARAGAAHEGRRLRSVPDPRTRDRARRRKGRSRHIARQGRFHHAAHAADRPDAQHPVEGKSCEDQAGRAHHQLRARRPDRRGGAEGRARQRPCRGRGARRVPDRTAGRRSSAVRHAELHLHAAPRRIDRRSAGQCRHPGGRTAFRLSAHRRHYQRAQCAQPVGRGGAEAAPLYEPRRKARQSGGSARPRQPHHHLDRGRGGGGRA